MENLVDKTIYAENMTNRHYYAISIKHTEYRWKFGKPCTLWGYHRTEDNENRCFGGYTEDINSAELYSMDEFITKYGSSICCSEPVKMNPNLCKKYKKYDTVLIDRDEYDMYYRMCKVG